MPRSRRTAVASAAAVVATALLAGCSAASADSPSSAASSAAPSGSSSSSASASLLAACGKAVTVQLPWWPGVDYAFLFQLIGSHGTVDADNNSYSGPIGDTGVTLTLRAGGPAAGFQRTQALAYQDDSIDFIVDSEGDQVGLTGTQPTVSVFSYYDTYPVVLEWGTDEWKFRSLQDIKASGATILAYGTASYLSALEHAGSIDAAQVDPSFDGSPARFVAAEGKIVQQDYITTGPYLLEHVIKDWGKPVHLLSVNKDFPVYGTTLQVRSDRLEEKRACLTEFVPLLQQASVDYAQHPADTNTALVTLTHALKGVSVQLTDELLTASNAAQLKYGLVRNGADGTFGSFDLARVQSNIDLLTPAFLAEGAKLKDGTKPADIATNEFLDPSITLPADVPVPANTLPDDVPGLG